MKYLWINIKKKLPLYIVCAVLFIISAFSVMSSQDFYIAYSVETGMKVYGEPNSGLLLYLILFFFIMTILPLFGMNYRNSLARSDLFRQAPYKNKRIRYMEHLSALTIILIAFTIGYVFLVLGMLIKNNLAKVPAADEMLYYELIKYHFVYYVPAYFIALAMGVCQYAIAYLFVSRSNNTLNSLMMLILGQLILLLYLFAPIYLFYRTTSFNQSTLGLPISFIYRLFEPLIIYGKGTNIFKFNSNVNAFASIQLIISLVVFFALAIIGIIAFFVEKDPSSEYAGRATSNKPYQEIIFHVAAFILGAFLCGLGKNLIYSFFSFFTFAAMYYTFYGLLNRNFKLKLWQIVLIVSIIGLVICTDIISISVNVINGSSSGLFF